jgi:hypothetical protein
VAEKKPVELDAGDLGVQALEIAKRRQAAAKDVLKLLEAHFGKHPSRPDTVLFAAAWLAGTSLYRSLGIEADIEPGMAVLSDAANQEGPKLLTVFSRLLTQFGITIKQEDLVFKMPPEHRPKTGILEIQRALQVPYNHIMRTHQFDYLEGAKTGAVVCALLVKALCKDSQTLKPELAAGIVSMGFVEGSKTAPAKLT